MEIGLRTEEHVRALVDLIFEKATTQHHFIEMWGPGARTLKLAGHCTNVRYTRLCVLVQRRLVSAGHLDEKLLKRVLNDRCQDHFMASLEPPGPAELPQDEEERSEALVKYTGWERLRDR